MTSTASLPVDIRKYPSANYEQLYSQFKWDIPEYFNIGQAISQVHFHDENAIAIFYDDVHEGQINWTFKELSTRSNQFANLLKELDLEKGDRVGVYLPSRPETVVALSAVYQLGCISLSISPLLRNDAIIYRLRHCEAKVLILENQNKEVRTEVEKIPTLEHIIVVEGEALRSKEIAFSELRSSSRNVELTRTKAEDPAQLFYTSGTTGPPKGVLHAHRFLLGHVPGFQMYFELAPKKGDVFWTPADWGWIGALGDVVLPALYFGMPVVAQRREGKFDPRVSLELMQRFHVTCAFIPPTALRLLRKTVAHPKKDYSLNLRVVSSAGESVGSELIRWTREELGVSVNEFYGCTESNLVVVSNSSTVGVKPGAMGKACPGHIVDIIDETGQVVSPGELGQISVKAPDPAMFLGYWMDQLSTEKKFLNGWFLTGDLAYKDREGYLWFKGRIDDMIKSAGYRIGPEEVELVINQHESVLESAVIAKPDELRGNILKAFVVLKKGFEPSFELIEEIQALVKEKLAAYAYPREIEFVNEIPKTATGKLKRSELRSRL